VGTRRQTDAYGISFVVRLTSNAGGFYGPLERIEVIGDRRVPSLFEVAHRA
jgi:hypothetical protein